MQPYVFPEWFSSNCRLSLGLAITVFLLKLLPMWKFWILGLKVRGLLNCIFQTEPCRASIATGVRLLLLSMVFLDFEFEGLTFILKSQVQTQTWLVDFDNKGLFLLLPMLNPGFQVSKVWSNLEQLSSSWMVVDSDIRIFEELLPMLNSGCYVSKFEVFLNCLVHIDIGWLYCCCHS